METIWLWLSLFELSSFDWTMTATILSIFIVDYQLFYSSVDKYFVVISFLQFLLVIKCFIQTAVIPLESSCPCDGKDGGFDPRGCPGLFMFLLGILAGFISCILLFLVWEAMARLVTCCIKLFLITKFRLQVQSLVLKKKCLWPKFVTFVCCSFGVILLCCMFRIIGFC